MWILPMKMYQLYTENEFIMEIKILWLNKKSLYSQQLYSQLFEYTSHVICEVYYNQVLF
jgi:hypothetical protein